MPLVRSHRSSGRAFTLVELIAVVVVLSILGGVAVVKYIEFGNRARMVSYAEHFSTLTRVCSQCAIDAGLGSNGVFTVHINPSNYASTGLASRLDEGALTAFGGQWSVTYLKHYDDTRVQMSINVIGLPGVGEFPSAGQELIQMLSGTAATNTVNTPEDAMFDDPEYWSLWNASYYLQYAVPGTYGVANSNKLRVDKSYTAVAEGPSIPDPDPPGY